MVAKKAKKKKNIKTFSTIFYFQNLKILKHFSFIQLKTSIKEIVSLWGYKNKAKKFVRNYDRNTIENSYYHLYLFDYYT